MVVGADRIGGMSTALDDPRITPIGKFLRRHKLDELPQFINVLVGEMSLVGPRPEMPAYTARYQGDERLILGVRPGITDYSSLHFIHLDEFLGDNTQADRVYESEVWPKKMELRMRYVRKHSFREDLSILWRTALRMFR